MWQTADLEDEWLAAADEDGWADGDEAILRSADVEYAKRQIAKEARQQAAAAREEWKSNGDADRERLNVQRAKQAVKAARVPALPKQPVQRKAGAVPTPPVHGVYRRRESHARWALAAVLLVAAVVVLVLAVSGVFHLVTGVPAAPASCPVHMVHPGWVILNGVKTWCGLP